MAQSVPCHVFVFRPRARLGVISPTPACLYTVPLLPLLACTWFPLRFRPPVGPCSFGRPFVSAPTAPLPRADVPFHQVQGRCAPLLVTKRRFPFGFGFFRSPLTTLSALLPWECLTVPFPFGFLSLPPRFSERTFLSTSSLLSCFSTEFFAASVSGAPAFVAPGNTLPLTPVCFSLMQFTLSTPYPLPFFFQSPPRGAGGLPFHMLKPNEFPTVTI